MWISITAFGVHFDSKCKGGKRKISVMNKFDTKAVRALLVTESKFITELLDKRNFPVAGNNDSGKSSYFSPFENCCIYHVQYTLYTA